MHKRNGCHLALFAMLRGASLHLNKRRRRQSNAHRLPSPSLSDCGDDQSGQPDSIGDRQSSVASSLETERPTSISASGPTRINAANLVHVTATAVLVERLDREAFVSRSRGNGASNERQGNDRGKNGLHGHLQRFAFVSTEASCLVTMK